MTTRDKIKFLEQFANDLKVVHDFIFLESHDELRRELQAGIQSLYATLGRELFHSTNNFEATLVSPVDESDVPF